MTRLTLSYYHDPAWGSVDLSESSETHRSFWALVLQFATADQGVAVHYQLDAGEDCLAIEVDGSNHVMEPPPLEYRDALLRAAKLLGREGAIQLETPIGVVVWQVQEERNGLRLSRIA